MERNRIKPGNSNAVVSEQSFTVPADMVMDVLQVVFNYDVSYQIIEVNSDDGYLTLNVNSRRQPQYYNMAVKNIEVLLGEYGDFTRLCDIR